MIRNNLKLNHGTFEYYVLQISSNTKLEEIQNKFSNFKNFPTRPGPTTSDKARIKIAWG